ncbi:MAG: DUF1311 domain-containing protein [Pararhodobacter sp.]|nr:DUF1311 domain-containing protein [Pararhodobacter sp.]
MVAMMLALATPAAAEIRYNADYTRVCLADGGGRDCIGLAADRCMEYSAGGYSTYGMNACLESERLWWDEALNAHYQDLRSRERANDTNAVPGQPPAAEALRDMQRAWIAFRDATCQYEALRWYGGTGASGQFLACQLRLTAEQALALLGYLAEG